jgi:uroporphyrinogen-III synthase
MKCWVAGNTMGMAIQSHVPTVLLTRPRVQSERFAAQLLAQIPGLQIVTAPVMEVEQLPLALPRRDWAGVVFTSEAAVESARRNAADLTGRGLRAFCVGDQTAKAAEQAGFQALSASGDASALVELIVAQGFAGPLLYLHGQEVRIDLGKSLNSAGIETVSRLCYRQVDRQLTEEATLFLNQEGEVVAPVFSPRSAQLLQAECVRLQARARLVVVAISAAAADVMAGHEVIIAARPDGTAMLQAVLARLT